MKKPFAPLLALTFTAVVSLFGAAPAFAGANNLRTIATLNSPAQDCAGSVLNQYSNFSASNLCWSGTNSGNYVPFSLKAMEAGTEVFPLVMGNTPTLEVYNDTGSTTVSLELVGSIGTNDPISCQGGNGSTGCEISGPLGTVGSATSGSVSTVYGPASTSSSWPAIVTVTFYGVPLNTYVGLQWSSWDNTDQSGVYLGGQVSTTGSTTGSCSLGLANAYNLISLTGNLSDAADIMGRIAAAGQVTQATTIGTALRTSDPYLSLASQNGGPWSIVAGGGIPTSNAFNVNAGGSVYSSTQTNASFNFANESYAGSLYSASQLVTGISSPVDFSTLSTGINKLSGQLSALVANGAICSVDNSGSMIPSGSCPSNPIYFDPNSQHYNPSWLVLYGTSTTINVFDISQAQFQNNSNNLDIEVPTGSTVIINVAGTTDTLQSDIYFQGNTVTDANAGNILFNFAAATAVTINGQMDATVLAPNANLTGGSQMGGVFVAASIGSTGEVHYIPFGGSIPCSSNPTGLSVTCAAVNSGTVGVAFDSGPMMVTGGTAPYTFSVVGTLPAGLSLNTATGEVSGTPTAAGTFSIQVTDASGNVSTMTCSITINPAPLSVTCAAVTTGTVGVAFNSGPMTVTGGTGPYTYSIVGTLPAGLTLNTATGAITGTPTTSGTFSVKVTDAAGNSSTSCMITINGVLSVTCAAVNTGEVGVAFNSGPMTVTGGTGPYTYSIVGTLPAGLTLNTATGAITGTPTASGTFSVKVTDAAGNSNTSCMITINGALSVTCAAVSTGEVGVAFNSGPMTVTGGTGPYTYSIVGTLPAGLTLNTATGAITGTPTASGTFSVKVTDAAGNSNTSCMITINGALSVTCAAVNTGEVGVAFNSGPMTVTGGTGPYTYSIVGSLPAGLSLNTTTGAITGTPTASGSFSVKVTDSKGATSTSCAITINSGLSVTCAAVNTGEVGVAFNSGPMTVTGGTGPYTYSIVGTMPAGLTLNRTTGAITGTPTASGTFSVKVTDAAGSSSTSCMITINGVLSVTCAAVNTGEVGVAFNSGPMTVTGGTAPYTYSVVGTLPAGLSLNTTTGAITGTPTASGTFSVKVTDAKGATSASCAITINSGLSVACAAVNTGEVGVAFNSGPMTVTGGTAPYTYSVVGTLPAGLSLNTTTGAITGTPTASGSFSVKVTDAKGATSTSCAITINPGLSVACAAVNTGEVGAAFNSGPMTVTGGTGPYTYSIVGTLPAGLTLNTTTGAITGTPTASGTFSVKVTDAKGATSASCAITINATVAVGPGDAATIGYWHNNNGQALINEMNGGASSTALANWLAANFPYLYGTNSSNNLTGKTNADVASLFMTFFGETGQKTNAQMMAGALAVYVTNPNLAGSNIAGSQGFNISSTGTGAKTINVGTDGAGAGLANNTSYSVMALLQQANLETQLGTLNATAFNSIFSNINQTGDIISGSSSAPLSVTCPAVTSGAVGVAFNSGSMAATGGTAPYIYSIVGTLPAGLTLNTATGAVTGTPTASGIFSIEVTDSSGAGSITSCSISIGTGYAISVNPSNVTVVAGQSANAAFTFTPFGGYVGTVSFSCSGLPAGATCTFVPASLTANGSNAVQTSTLTVTTSASGTTTIAQNRTTSGTTLASVLLLPGLLLGGFIAWRRRSFTVRTRGMLLLLLVGSMLIGGTVGCGTVSLRTPPGAQVVTVVANTTVSSTGSASSQTATFTLTILP